MSSYDISRYAVIGAGNMGSGIAQKIATEGFEVVLVDIDDDRVAAGLKRIETLLAEGVERRIFAPKQAEAILSRVSGTSDWERLGDVDLVVEAVFENLDVKRKVFARLAEVCRPDAILGTNTSSFFVRDVAAGVPHPERVVGLHYFYHPAKNRLVEVIGHEGVSEDAISAVWASQEAIGKTPIAGGADAPGFVVNRYFVPWLNEAVRMLAAGVADIATIDAAAKRAFKIGMGPFELMNVTGVPIALHAATTLGAELGAFYAPEERLAQQVAAGDDWDLAGEPDEALFGPVGDRLLGVVFQVAGELVDEGVASVEDIDIGARVGLRWRLGPFDLVNRVGVARARTLAAAAGAPFERALPAALANAPESGVPISLASSAPRGGLCAVQINRPDAMNALNPALMTQLGETLEQARAYGKPLVLTATGKAFVAGADIKFFVDNLRSDSFPAIQAFTEAGHNVLSGLSGGDQAVVARVHGLSLGGGSELALACDRVVCSPKASFGFPETGIGIIPGLGGMPRTARRIGLPLAKFLVYTGHTVGAADALELGLCDAIADFAGLDAACEGAATDGPTTHDALPSGPRTASWRPIWDFFQRYSVRQILGGEAEAAGNPMLEKAIKRMGHKSAAALLLAEELFDAGASVSLTEALQLELTELHRVFAHPDALEGLSAMLERRRPGFEALA